MNETIMNTSEYANQQVCTRNENQGRGRDIGREERRRGGGKEGGRGGGGGGGGGGRVDRQAMKRGERTTSEGNL